MSEKIKRHKMVVIGFCGIKRCYLDIAPKDALQRYIKSDGQVDDLITVEDYKKRGLLKVHTFRDEFEAYDIYG
jgi:hypothetical protein